MGTMINAYANAGDTAGAEAWFEKSRQLSIRLDDVIYNTMIKAGARVGNTQWAEHWLERAVRAGIEPDKVGPHRTVWWV